MPAHHATSARVSCVLSRQAMTLWNEAAICSPQAARLFARLHPVSQAAGPSGFVRDARTASATQWRRQWRIIIAAAAVMYGESARMRMRWEHFTHWSHKNNDLDLGCCAGTAAAASATAGVALALGLFTFSLTSSCNRAKGCEPLRRLSMASRLLREEAIIICSTTALLCCFASSSPGKGERRPLPELLALLLLPSLEGRSGSTISKSWQ